MIVYGEPVFLLKSPAGKKAKGKGKGKKPPKGIGAGNGKKFGLTEAAIYAAQPSLAPPSGFGYDYGNDYGNGS